MISHICKMYLGFLVTGGSTINEQQPNLEKVVISIIRDGILCGFVYTHIYGSLFSAGRN